MPEFNLLDKLQDLEFQQTIDLGEGVSTPGDPNLLAGQTRTLEVLKGLSLEGKRVLDIGCRDGLFALEMEIRGAQEVVAIDHQVSSAATRFLLPYLKSQVKMFELNLFDLTPETFGTFDVVCFSVTAHYLRYPFWALKIVRDVLRCDGALVLESKIQLKHPKEPVLFCRRANKSITERGAETDDFVFNLSGLQNAIVGEGFSVEKLEVLEKNSDYASLGHHSKFNWIGRVMLEKYFGTQKKPRETDHAVLVCHPRNDSNSAGRQNESVPLMAAPTARRAA